MSTTALTSVSNNKASKKKVSVIAFDDIPPAEEEHDSAADDEGVEVPPHFAEEAPPRRLNSELDPALVIAATIFVEELVKTAEEEVQSRFNQEGRPHESQVRPYFSVAPPFMKTEKQKENCKRKRTKTFSLCFCLPKKFPLFSSFLFFLR